MERFIGLGSTVVDHSSTETIVVKCPLWPVVRLEVDSLVMAAFNIVDIRVSDGKDFDESLFEQPGSVMAETFRPGNTAVFNPKGICAFARGDALHIHVHVRNERSSTFVFRGTLYGEDLSGYSFVTSGSLPADDEIRRLIATGQGPGR